MKIKINDQIIDINDAKSLFERFFGLMFKKEIKKSLYFKNCHSVHTFFMFNHIDVIMTDKNNVIIQIFRNVSPWKIVSAKATHTYEFKTGYVQSATIGDEIKII